MTDKKDKKLTGKAYEEELRRKADEWTAEQGKKLMKEKEEIREPLMRTCY